MPTEQVVPPADIKAIESEANEATPHGRAAYGVIAAYEQHWLHANEWGATEYYNRFLSALNHYLEMR